jgi:hypothetical protein
MVYPVVPVAVKAVAAAADPEEQAVTEMRTETYLLLVAVVAPAHKTLF